MNTDRVEKQIDIHAPRHRVWQALTDSKQFGEWFGMKLDGPFIAGKPITGKTTATLADPAVAEMQKEYEGLPVMLSIADIRPEDLFSFRWHPYAIEPGVDYSHEPMTLIEFTLRDADKGTHVTVTETGFDKIPLERRAKAFAMNEEGWEEITKLLSKYLAHE